MSQKTRTRRPQAPPAGPAPCRPEAPAPRRLPAPILQSVPRRRPQTGPAPAPEPSAEKPPLSRLHPRPVPRLGRLVSFVGPCRLRRHPRRPAWPPPAPPTRPHRIATPSRLRFRNSTGQEPGSAPAAQAVPACSPGQAQPSAVRPRIAPQSQRRRSAPENTHRPRRPLSPLLRWPNLAPRLSRYSSSSSDQFLIVPCPRRTVSVPSVEQT
ncbi:hypothetical protein TRIHO_39480 [Tritonibacter horizontis]|uniref:Uncharacterized protein n=1 Tax=Tritonibacter horizontis TaxID=1768241 RepID=A0A132BT61_9RHOB|nr:hypothetical protein TRIHO_39480 [Tritonibacter horizontis]